MLADCAYDCGFRAAREEDGANVDCLHALAIHQYRATHKTQSQIISLLHLLSVYGTHPELRRWLHATQSGVMQSVAMYYDRILEYRNMAQKERATSRLNMMNSLHMTPLLPAMMHARQVSVRVSYVPVICAPGACVSFSACVSCMHAVRVCHVRVVLACVCVSCVRVLCVVHVGSGCNVMGACAIGLPSGRATCGANVRWHPCLLYDK